MFYANLEIWPPDNFTKLSWQPVVQLYYTEQRRDTRICLLERVLTAFRALAVSSSASIFVLYLSLALNCISYLTLPGQ